MNVAQVEAVVRGELNKGLTMESPVEGCLRFLILGGSCSVQMKLVFFFFFLKDPEFVAPIRLQKCAVLRYDRLKMANPRLFVTHRLRYKRRC